MLQKQILISTIHKNQVTYSHITTIILKHQPQHGIVNL